MATIKELISKYIAEASKSADSQQAVSLVVSRVNKLTEYTNGKRITKEDKLSALRSIKNAANDEHLTLISQIMSELEKDEK